MMKTREIPVVKRNTGNASIYLFNSNSYKKISPFTMSKIIVLVKGNV